MPGLRQTPAGQIAPAASKGIRARICQGPERVLEGAPSSPSPVASQKQSSRTRLTGAGGRGRVPAPPGLGSDSNTHAQEPLEKGSAARACSWKKASQKPRGAGSEKGSALTFRELLQGQTLNEERTPAGGKRLVRRSGATLPLSSTPPEQVTPAAAGPPLPRAAAIPGSQAAR